MHARCTWRLLETSSGDAHALLQPRASQTALPWSSASLSQKLHHGKLAPATRVALVQHKPSEQAVHTQESENAGPPRNGGSGYAGGPHNGSPQDGLSDCILLAACGANELLPQSPHVPADVFTACLTTPIKARSDTGATSETPCGIHTMIVYHIILQDCEAIE